MSKTNNYKDCKQISTNKTILFRNNITDKQLINMAIKLGYDENDLVIRQARVQKQFIYEIQNSPYYDVAWVYMKRKGIVEPTIVDILEAYHEIAKVDNKFNQKRKINATRKLS